MTDDRAILVHVFIVQTHFIRLLHILFPAVQQKKKKFYSTMTELICKIIFPAQDRFIYILKVFYAHKFKKLKLNNSVYNDSNNR